MTFSSAPSVQRAVTTCSAPAAPTPHALALIEPAQQEHKLSPSKCLCSEYSSRQQQADCTSKGCTQGNVCISATAGTELQSKRCELSWLSSAQAELGQVGQESKLRGTEESGLPASGRASLEGSLTC